MMQKKKRETGFYCLLDAFKNIFQSGRLRARQIAQASQNKRYIHKYSMQLKNKNHEMVYAHQSQVIKVTVHFVGSFSFMQVAR